MNQQCVEYPLANSPFPRGGGRHGILVLFAVGLMVGSAGSPLHSQTPPEDETAPSGRTVARAYLIPVPLPITGTVDTHVKQRIAQVLTGLRDAEPRPVLILEFRSRSDQAGEASEFERCLSLARYLASDRLGRVRAVAYLPGNVKGHAVLPVIACEEIVMAAEADLGDAGLNETFIDPTLRRGYSEIAERRRTIPVAVVLGMLDKELAVHRAQTLDGIRYVLEDELEELKQKTTVSSVESVVRPGDLVHLNGRDLRLKYGFVSHLANDRSELAAALQLPSTAIEEDPSLGGEWVPIRVDVEGPINAKAINWIERSIRQRLADGRVNFVCIWLDSPGGSATDSLRLAHYLSSLDPSEVRTVAYVGSEARADASMIALACDHLVVADDAILGGPGAVEIPQREMPELRRALEAIADDKHRDWSLSVSLVDRELTVHRYAREGTGEIRYFTVDELAEQDDPNVWKRGDEVEVRRGLSGREAEQLKLARFLASDYEEFKQLYHLENELDRVEPNWAHLLIEKLASPQIAGALLFIAWFALLMEFSQPGLGVAGFISTLCFVLYFWSHFLHGTAGWLEVILFLAGVTSVIVEVFVIPGFGIFGFGGGLLIISSMVFASQTFTIPRNSYQLEQLPSSLMMVAAAGAGAFASLVVMRRYLPDAPVLKRMMLASPNEEERDDLARRESLVSFAHLIGKRGRTTTQLTPSGKACFGDEVLDVISDGDVIPLGADIVVAEVMGNHVYVQPIDSDRG